MSWMKRISTPTGISLRVDGRSGLLTFLGEIPKAGIPTASFRNCGRVLL